MTDATNGRVGWAYWAWKYYSDPRERRRTARHGQRAPALDARVLSRAYPQAVAGTPIRYSFSPATDVFDMAYVPNHHVHAPTLVFVPTALHYRHGYCARTTGAKVTSARGSDLLQVRNATTGHRVTVEITPGPCGPGSAHSTGA